MVTLLSDLSYFASSRGVDVKALLTLYEQNSSYYTSIRILADEFGIDRKWLQKQFSETRLRSRYIAEQERRGKRSRSSEVIPCKPAPRGQIASQLTRLRMSITRKGVEKDQEWINNVVAARKAGKGWSHTQETRDRISNTLSDRVIACDVRLRMRDGQRKRREREQREGISHRNCRVVITPKGQFGSIALASKAHGITRQGGRYRLNKGLWT